MVARRGSQNNHKSQGNRNSKAITLANAASVRRSALFGAPLLLENEDPAIYDSFVSGVCAALKPVDLIDEIFVDDVVRSEWEVLRWHRVKSALIKARGLAALKGFLRKSLDFYQYAEDYIESLPKKLER